MEQRHAWAAAMPLTFAILRPSELQQGPYLLESDNATRCRSKWSSAFLGALASHPRKVLSLHNASHLFVDLETRFELLEYINQVADHR